PHVRLVAADGVGREGRQQDLFGWPMRRRVGSDRRRRNERRARFTDHDATRGKVLGVVRYGAHLLVPARKICAHEPVGMRDRAFLPKLIPDRIGVFDPPRIEMIEIGRPVGDSGTFVHGTPRYSSMTSIASSGQLDCASQAFAARLGATTPSPTSWAFPNSSSANSSGASALQRA